MAAATPSDWDDAPPSPTSDLDPTGPRLIRPLPKRQRLLPSAPPSPPVPTLAAPVLPPPGKAHSPVEFHPDGAADTDDSAGGRKRFEPRVPSEPALEYRPGPPGLRTLQHPPRRPPSDSGEPAEPDGVTAGSDSDNDAPDADADAGADEDDEAPALGAGGGSDSIFGVAGREIKRALKAASRFSSAGLFGGLGLAALHPSLAPPPPSPTKAHGGGGDDDDEDDDAESSASFSGRDAVPVAGGNNKKKRKIPGLTHVPPGEDADRAFDDDEAPPLSALTSLKQIHVDFVGLGSLPKDTPKTAKAALAKLRYRPPHVSLVPAALSHRRHANRVQTARERLHPPLPLEPVAAFALPLPSSTTTNGPPPLPPGSGLKGSKALKAAMKAERDREREKARITLVLGGKTLTLPNLWDPLGREKEAAARERRRTGAELKSGYLTPPASTSSDGEVEELALVWKRETPALAEFAFVANAPGVIPKRWRAVTDQVERLRLAKARADRAREDEKLRKLEQAAADEAAGTSRAAASGDADPLLSDSLSIPLSNVYVDPDDPDSAVAIHPSVEPSSPAVPSPLAPPAGGGSSSPSSLDPAAPPSGAPPRKAPVRKGKKKRSAHANANNVHHRDNYIPSRMPAASSSGRDKDANGGADSGAGLTSWPASQEALAAATAGGGGPRLALGPDEWLCAFCEYELFFGEESQLAKAVRKRKNVLKVRRRARERAAKAANGGHDPTPAAAPSS